MRFGLLASFAVVLAVGVAPAAHADGILLNGGFELFTPPPDNSFNMDWAKPTYWLSTLSAFTASAQAFSPNTLTVNPHSGNRMGVLAPGGMQDNAVWQQLDFGGVTAATLSFWWGFQARDYDEADNGHDRFQVLISKNFNPQNQNPTWDLLWDSALDAAPGPWVVGDWTRVTVPLDVSGTGLATIRFGLINASNGGEYGVIDKSGQLTTVFLDDVSVEAVPEPASLLLLGSGLIGAGLARRKRRGTR